MMMTQWILLCIKKYFDELAVRSFRWSVEEKMLEVRGIDPRTSRMLSERSTI